MTSAENPKSDRDLIEQRIRALLRCARTATWPDC